MSPSARPLRRTGAGFGKAAAPCIGSRQCQKARGEAGDKGLMCPRFRIHQEDPNSTRGRAALLRQALDVELGKAPFAGPNWPRRWTCAWPFPRRLVAAAAPPAAAQGDATRAPRELALRVDCCANDLDPAVADAAVQVLRAAGCRHPIRDGAQRQSLHLAQLLQAALPLSAGLGPATAGRATPSGAAA